ncbi:asparaginase (plasmid) [Mycolicibacterium aichiense]|uniref:asparaginase n=1 Tax=Mycolicibacterium aichiense TaxID=1799 RepID=UPI003D6774C1
MQRILVIFTGGTIGSQFTGDTINVVAGQTYRLLRDFESRVSASVAFDVIEPINILSEDARPEDWAAIANAVIHEVRPEHAGVVVTHGTDTLAYSAAALALALGLHHVEIPVVLVSSDLPLDDPSANGLSNFADAVQVISALDGPGVFVTYRNPDGRRLVHLGCRTLPISSLDHYLYSVCHAHIGEFNADGTLNLSLPEPIPPSSMAVDRNRPVVFSTDVTLLRPYPGLNYDRIDLAGSRAVVHALYHSGTASTVDDVSHNIIKFGARCRDAGIPLFATPVPPGIGHYESSVAFPDAGITPIARMPVDVAYVKTSLGVGLGLDGSELVKFVGQQEIANEFV